MRIFVVAGVMLLAAVGLTACGSGGGSASQAKTVVYDADYPAYDSLNLLYHRADLVVQATVTGAGRVEKMRATTGGSAPQSNPNAGTNNDQSTDDPLIVTVFQVRVDRVFKGAANPGDTVDVKQLGGDYGGISYQEQGSVQLRPGPYLLFLAVFPDSPASLLNPNQAQYPMGRSGALSQVGGNTISFSVADLTALAQHE